jgi:hypothetical protein
MTDLSSSIQLITFKVPTPAFLEINIEVSGLLEGDGAYTVELSAVADAFSKHFQSVCNKQFPIDSSFLSQSSACLSLAPVSDADVCNAIKRLNPPESFGLNDILGFVVEGGSVVFIPILRHMFNLSLTEQCFHTVWKEVAVVPYLKEAIVPPWATADQCLSSLTSPSYSNSLIMFIFCITLNLTMTSMASPNLNPQVLIW